MAFIRDDDAIAEAVLLLCDAVEIGDCDERDACLRLARKHAQAVLDRTKSKKQPKPEQPEEGTES